MANTIKSWLKPFLIVVVISILGLYLLSQLQQVSSFIKMDAELDRDYSPRNLQQQLIGQRITSSYKLVDKYSSKVEPPKSIDKELGKFDPPQVSNMDRGKIDSPEAKQKRHGKVDRSEATTRERGKVDRPETTSIEVMIKELGIARSKWMDQPVVTPFPYRFVHNPAKACYNKSVEILFAVPVSRSHFKQRQAVRETWGSYAKEPTNKAVLLFFLGSSSEKESPDVQTEIDKESARYSDIVQVQFVDTYRNLSLKSMSILKWMDAYCRHTDFLTKADDDVYVVMPTLINQLRQTRTGFVRWRFVFGVKMSGQTPHRHKESKWYVSAEEFADVFYPTFTSGTSYSMTGGAARLIFQAALRTPIFWLEDVYITGLCARKASIYVSNNPLQTNLKFTPSGCEFRSKSIGHYLDENEIRTIHRELHDKKLTCSSAASTTK